MSTEQLHQWATQLLEIPTTFYAALAKDNDRVIRHRPAPGEWSAIEVIGHMIDKLSNWSLRVERIWREDHPTLLGYDQDAEVAKHEYQHADPADLYEQLEKRCKHFASLVTELPTSALQRTGMHSEFGSLAIQQCIEMTLGSVPEHLAQLRAAQLSASTIKTE